MRIPQHVVDAAELANDATAAMHNSDWGLAEVRVILLRVMLWWLCAWCGTPPLPALRHHRNQ